MPPYRAQGRVDTGRREQGARVQNYHVPSAAREGDGAVGSSTPASITALVSSLPIMSIAVGSTQQVTALVYNALGEVLPGVQPTNWLSTTPSIASVDGNGLVTGHAAGTTTITATIDSITSNVLTATVTGAVVDQTPSSILVTPSSVTISSGSSPLTAVVKNGAGDALALVPTSWTTTNAAVATVNGSGVVTAVTVGSATITAHYNAIASNGVSVTVSAAGTQSLVTVTQPRTFLSTDVADTPCAKTRTIVCSTAGQFQAALDDLQADDWIKVTAGVTLAGQFTVTHGGTAGHWAWIDTTGTKPAEFVKFDGEGHKATHNPPILTTADTNFALLFSTGAQYIRMMGIEVTASSGATSIDTLVGLSSGQETSNADLSQFIVIDRCYIHSRVGVESKRAVQMQNKSSAVIYSTCDQIFNFGVDAQAILGWNGPGPYKIVWCTLEATGECLAWGGATPNNTDNIPSDVECHHCLLTRRLTIKAANYDAKNASEGKTGLYHLYHSNVYHNQWADDQLGWAFVYWSVNQPDQEHPDGRFPLAETGHITIRDSVVINCASIGQFIGAYITPSVLAHHIAVSNIVAIGLNNSEVAEGGLGWLVGNTGNLSIEHTTGFLNGGTSYYQLANSSVIVDHVFKNNLGGGGQYPINVSPAPTTWAAHTSGASANAGNVTAGPDAGYYASTYAFPAGNYYPTSFGDIGNVGGPTALTSKTATLDDLALSESSPYKRAGTDGTDAGADIARVKAAVAGVGGGF